MMEWLVIDETVCDKIYTENISWTQLRAFIEVQENVFPDLLSSLDLF